MDTPELQHSPDSQKPCRTPRLNMDRSLTTEEAADMIGVAAATLRDWKGQRTGPAYIQLSARCVRYSERDVRQFISDRRVVPSVRSVGRFQR